ncbi:MAG: glycosyl transferase [Thermodesulfobacteriota bacterium]
MQSLFYPVLAFVICLAATPAARLLAAKTGRVAKPRADRWHAKPTAMLGGIAIFAGFLIPVLLLSGFSFSRLFFPAESVFVLRQGGQPAQYAGMVLMLGACCMFIVGLVDDFLRIKPQTKLLGQIMTASLVTYFGFRLNWSGSLTLDTILTIFWVVGITNALNLLDNMDGLCAGVGCVAALSLAVVLAGKNLDVALFALCLAGSLGAFLAYNFNPASIFMGDCGSLVIGFTLSFLGLSYSGSAGPGMPRLAVPLLILMVPIFDTTLVTVIRLLSGRKASTGGRDHTSHRLVLIGMSERKAVLFLYGTAAVSGLAAVFVHRADTLTGPAVVVPVAVSVILMGFYLAQLRIYPEKEFSVLRDRNFTPVLLELTYKRQIGLVLLDFALIAFSYYMAYRLRFSRPELSVYFDVFLRSLPAVIACKLFSYFLLGVYRGVWGFFSFNDIYGYLKASALGSLLSVAVVTFVYRFQDFSKGIFVIDWFIATGFLLGTRGSFRLFSDALKKSTLSGERVLIYGAGRGGEILLRELVNNNRLGLRPEAFVDDDPLKAGKRLTGYTIFGSLKKAEGFIAEKKITGILISFRNANPEKMKELNEFCRSHSLFIKQFTIGLSDVGVID